MAMVGSRSPIGGTSRCAALVVPTIADGNAARPVVPEGVLVGGGKTSKRVSSSRASTAAQSNIRQDIHDQTAATACHRSSIHACTRARAHAHAPHSQQQQQRHIPHSSTAQLSAAQQGTRAEQRPRGTWSHRWWAPLCPSGRTPMSLGLGRRPRTEHLQRSLGRSGTCDAAPPTITVGRDHGTQPAIEIARIATLPEH
jgi:hypothetical protein